MTEPNLASIQQQFAETLHYREHHLAISTGVAEPDSLIQVYRNNFVVSLTQCLTDVYPVVFSLIGEECFHALARHHILNTPMTDACVQRYGGEFNNTISSIPNIIESVPYLADIATLEWHIQQINPLAISSITPPSDALSTLTLSNVTPPDVKQIQLHVSPAIHVIQSAFAIGRIWKSITDNDEALLSTINPIEPESLIIRRNKEGLILTTIDTNEAALIIACKTAALGNIEPALLSYLPSAIAHFAFTDFSYVPLNNEDKRHE